MRQSSAAILDASSDAKLAKAFEQIEQLSKELGDAKTKIKYHVRSAPSSACLLPVCRDCMNVVVQEDELKEVRDSSAHEETIDRLERKLTEATEEISKLETQVTERTQWNEKLTRDCASQ